MRLLTTILVVLAIVSLVIGVATVFTDASSKDSVLYYEYGIHTCPHCRAMKAFFEKYYPDNYYFCDILSSQECAEYFARWTNKTGIPPYVPQIIVIKNYSYVLAIVIGEVENKTLFDYLATLEPSTKIPVYSAETTTTARRIGYIRLANMSIHSIIISDLIYLPEKTVTPTTTTPAQTNHTATVANTVPNTVIQNPVASNQTTSNSNPLTMLVPLALADSVNPCTITIYTLLLTTIAVMKGRRKAFISGVLFIGGVFTGYLLLGLGILYGISMVTIPDIIPKILLGGFGTYLIVSAILSRKKECIVCREGECKNRETRISRFLNVSNYVARSSITHYAFGLLLSLTLLPCSMGPYIVFLVTLRQSPVSAIPYLLLYNIIFVVPLLAVLATITAGRRICPSIDKYRPIIYVIAGIALIILSIFQ